MRARGAVIAAAGLAVVVVLGGTSGAQDYPNERAPVVRVYSQNGPGVASNYVTPAIDLGEDAYVFAVSIDLDGQIQVLHPDFPGISVRLRSHQQFRLPNFFAGFSRSNGAVYSPSGYGSYTSYGALDDSRGTVIALASRQPFNLERIESDGDWNLLAIRNLVERQTPLGAEDALASYLGAKGEPIGRDFMRFATFRQNYYADYGNDLLSSCDLFNSSFAFESGLAFRRLAVLERVAQFRRSGKVARIVGYDSCGMPILFFGPSRVINGRPRAPRQPADTDHAKRFGVPRPRTNPNSPNTAPRAALGYFPRTRPTGPPQAGDVIIAAPRRFAKPGQVLLDTRNQPAMGVMAGSNRAPVERALPPRVQGAATGAVAPQVYTPPAPRNNPPPPRTEPTRSSPPPRVETPRSSPAPVSSPPPRVDTKAGSQPPPSRQ
jgi:hypothetical protein